MSSIWAAEKAVQTDWPASRQILVVLSLVKLDPKPKQVIFGNLSDVSTVLASISWNSTSK